MSESSKPKSGEAKSDPSGSLQAAASGGKDPEVVDRAMRKMAERAPDDFVEISAMMGGMMGHPLHQKMNQEHITKMLDLAVQHDTNEFELRKTQQSLDAKNHGAERTTHLIYFGVFIGLVVFIVLVFKAQPGVLGPILTGIGGAATGFVGGFGYAKSGQKKKS